MPGTGGVFRVEIDGELLWDRTRDGGFPEIAPLKRLVRDRVAPGRSLGHTDSTALLDFLGATRPRSGPLVRRASTPDEKRVRRLPLLHSRPRGLALRLRIGARG